MTHFVALSFAKIMGWNPERDLSLMSGANTMDALKSGRVDALIASELHEVMALSAGYKILVDLAKYNIPNAGSGVSISRAWLKDNQEAARRFVKSTVETIALVKRNKPAAFNAMAKWYKVTDPEKQEHFYREISNLPRKPYPSVEGIKKVMEIYNYHEMRKYKPEDFYDDSFVRQLDQSKFIDSLYE